MLGTEAIVRSSVHSFGVKHSRETLAETVLELYDAALQESSRRTYNTGQLRYFKFMNQLPSHTRIFPFKKTELSSTELTLAFFMAYLVLEPTISSWSTILGYETHVKYMFREEGCDPAEYQTPFLGQIRKGIKNTLPTLGDKRRAFLLPEWISRPGFIVAEPRSRRLLRFATILGFVGLLRPHTLRELTASKIRLVTRRNKVIKLPQRQRDIPHTLAAIRSKERLLGFYIQFQSKTMRSARAFFPNLCSPKTEYTKMCPTRTLVEVASRGIMKGEFLKQLMKGSHLSKYLQEIANTESKIAPYALRIGARTWLISQGMDRQFVDYLGTWSSPEASARYYRANPAAVLKKIRTFFKDLPNPAML